MERQVKRSQFRFLWIAVVMVIALMSIGGVLMMAQNMAITVQAAPIEPPAGYPKLNQSRMTVDPTLASVGRYVPGVCD